MLIKERKKRTWLGIAEKSNKDVNYEITDLRITNDEKGSVSSLADGLTICRLMQYIDSTAEVFDLIQIFVSNQLDSNFHIETNTEGAMASK